MIETEPYLPEITLQDILAFDPENSETYTSSRLVNAVAKILCTITLRHQADFAERLQLDKNHLTIAIKMETGMALKDLIIQYRLTKIQEYMSQNPGKSSTEVAEHFGFSTYHTLWRFFHTHTGETPEGEKSKSPRVDNYHKMVKEIHQRVYRSWELPENKE